MRLKLFFGVLLSVLLFACSSDDGDDGTNSIVGTWDLVSVELDGTTEEEQAIELLFDLLAAQECYLITMIFSDSGQATLESSLAYLEIDETFLLNPMIDCPTESDSEIATYTYEDGQLSITDSDGFTSTVSVTLSGDRLTVDLEDFGFDDVGSTGTMTFERR